MKNKELTIKEYTRITQNFALIYGNDLNLKRSEVVDLSDVHVECFFDIETELSDLVTDFLSECEGFSELKDGFYSYTMLIHLKSIDDWSVIDSEISIQEEWPFFNAEIDHDNTLPF